MDEHAVTRLEELVHSGPGRVRHDILEAVATAEREVLHEALDRLDPDVLLRSVGTRFRGRGLRDELLDVLTVQRVHEVSVPALAGLARALQRGPTAGRAERALRDILVSRIGAELTHVKNTINLSRDRHDLEGLVFADIDDEQVRFEILDHFRAQAGHVPVREVKILSDIDDTAVARLHEERYPKGTVVPGIMAFYEALDVGPHDAPMSRGDLTFVTARPSDVFGLVKGESRRALADAGVTNLSIMTGSWFRIFTRGGMAKQKVENIAHYTQLFPEYDLVFLGDSGQGDIDVAKQIRSTYSDVVRAAFIHDVVALPQADRDALAAAGVWVVDTYVGAALKAHELGLISDDGLRTVIDDTRTDMDRVEWESPEQEQAMWALVNRDIDLAERDSTP